MTDAELIAKKLALIETYLRELASVSQPSCFRLLSAADRPAGRTPVPADPSLRRLLRSAEIAAVPAAHLLPPHSEALGVSEIGIVVFPEKKAPAESENSMVAG